MMGIRIEGPRKVAGELMMRALAGAGIEFDYQKEGENVEHRRILFANLNSDYLEGVDIDRENQGEDSAYRRFRLDRVCPGSLVVHRAAA